MKVIHKEIWSKSKEHKWLIDAYAPCGRVISNGSKFNSKVTCKRCLKKMKGAANGK